MSRESAHRAYVEEDMSSLASICMDSVSRSVFHFFHIFEKLQTPTLVHFEAVIWEERNIYRWREREGEFALTLAQIVSHRPTPLIPSEAANVALPSATCVQHARSRVQSDAFFRNTISLTLVFLHSTVLRFEDAMSHPKLSHILRQAPQIPYYAADQNASTSRKPWADTFKMFAWDVQAVAYGTFMTKFENLNEEDVQRLNVDPRNDPDHPTRVVTEGDTSSHIDENVIIHLKQAFTTFPYIIFEARHGPGQAAPRNSPEIVMDWSFKYKDEFVTVGECKKPGVIRQPDWEDPTRSTTATLALARECLGYAFYYNCPRVWCYDGVHLLLLRWNTSDRNQFSKSTPESWCIPVDSGPNNVSVRFALYMFMREGVHAIHGARQNQLHLQGLRIGNAWLRYDMRGRPILWNGQQWTFAHPGQWERELDVANGRWYWTDPDDSQPPVTEMPFT